MNSQVTLMTESLPATSKGQVRLLYKRMDQKNAALLEDGSPNYFLATSDDCVSSVKIRDAAQHMVAEVDRRSILNDTLKLPNRNGGKVIKSNEVLKKAKAMDGRKSTTLHTEEGTYHWHNKRGHNWALYEDSSSTPVAWTETVPSSSPTWMLVLETRALNIMDYVLASLFYLKGSQSNSADGWEHVDARTAWFSTK